MKSIADRVKFQVDKYNISYLIIFEIMNQKFMFLHLYRITSMKNVHTPITFLL